MAEALESGDQNKIEKVIGEKMKANMEAKRKEQERKAKLMNADPNDADAQRLIEEEIKKELIN